MDTFYEKRLTR